jgi:hypothetical protein
MKKTLGAEISSAAAAGLSRRRARIGATLRPANG